MPVTAAPSTYYNFFKTTLKRSMTSTSQTTGIVLDKILDNSGNAITFATTPMILTFIKGDKREIISAGGFTQDANGDFTLTDVTRDLPFDGSSFTGQGNPVKFTSKATVFLGLTGQTLSNLIFANNATFTVAPTFGKGASFTAFADTTARDAYFTSPVNGDMCFVTGTGMQYYDGAWNTFGTATVNDASTTVKGIVEEATDAEIGAGTAAGATSARLFINPSSTVKTSSGAGDENKIPVLNADGALNIGHIATGTPDGTKFVRDDGTLAAVTITPTHDLVMSDEFIDLGSAVGTFTDEFTVTKNYPAGTIAVGDAWHIRGNLEIENRASYTMEVRFRLAGTTFYTYTTTADVTVDLDFLTIVRTNSSGIIGIYTTGKRLEGSTLAIFEQSASFDNSSDSLFDIQVYVNQGAPGGFVSGYTVNNLLVTKTSS